MFFVILQLLYVTRLSFGSQEYITVLNVRHINAEDGRRFQCYTPQIVPGDMLSYGRSYQIDSTDSLTDIPWTVSVGETRYVTPDPPVAGGNVGVYYCKFTNDDVTTIVQTTKRDSDAVIIPSNDKTTVSANIGDNVTIIFDVKGDVNRPFVWRKDGVEISSDDTESLMFNPVNPNNAGIYEVHGTDQRIDRKHSFIKLIVRACPRHKWGPPDCTGDCGYCYNGGVCDDKTGLCICAPGFKGKFCEVECGTNSFGWNCEKVCTQDVNRQYPCEPGFLICLPDPYGCSCLTGYSGPDCRTRCSVGTFGAGCTQVCRCNSGTCDIYTGGCTGSDTTCQARWTGSNCQECVSNSFGENCEQTCSKPCTCSRTGACAKGTCHQGWLEPKCETGISDVTFIPANYGEMTDAYCIISTTSGSSTVDILLQVTTNDHKENRTWSYSEEDIGIRTYKFTVLAVFGTKYTCLIHDEVEYAEKEIPSIIFQQPSYNGILQAVVLSGSTIEVLWTEWNNVTNTGDGPIIGYILHYRKTNNENDNKWEQTSIINGLSTIVEGLLWETSYTFAVSAVRKGEGGQGPTGEQRFVAQTLCGEPESIKNIQLETLTDSTIIIKVTWSEIKNEHDVLKCSDLTYYYTVYVKIGNGEGAEYEELHRGQNTVFLYGDIKIGTDYVIAVTVSNKDSESKFMERSIHAPSEINVCRSSTYLVVIIVQSIILTLLVVYCLVQLIQRRRVAGNMNKKENKANGGDEGKVYEIPSPVIAAEYHATGIVNSGADCGDYAEIRQIQKHS